MFEVYVIWIILQVHNTRQEKGALLIKMTISTQYKHTKE